MNYGASDKKLHTEEYWQEQLQHPDWYIRLEDYLKERIFPVSKNINEKRLRQSFYETVESMLIVGKIPLAKKGPDLDAQRKPIDALVIHHTSENPDITLSKLSAIGLVRQYGTHFIEGDIVGHKVRGNPVWSGHFKDGRMVFFAYHWLVRPNGDYERLLEDNCIGLQSGNWDVNTRSIAIVLSGDYSNRFPSEEQINSIKKIISGNYSGVDKNRILGHREVNPKATCPGNKFLGSKGWKNILRA